MCVNGFRNNLTGFGFERRLGGLRVSESLRILCLASTFGPDLQRFVEVGGGG